MRSKGWMNRACGAALLACWGSGALLAEAIGTTKDTRVADAAMQSDVEGVRSLIKQKADVNTAQGDGMTALHWAAFKDDIEMARLLTGSGANVKAETRNDGLTPLYMACVNGNAAMIRVLIKGGASARAASRGGVTALMTVAASGSVEAVNALIDAGADVNAREPVNGQNALMFAASKNRGAVIQALVAKGADVAATTNVVQLAVASFDENGNPKSRSRGGEREAGGNTQTGGMTALLFAAREGHLGAIRALMTAGADVNQASVGERTSPLVAAIENGHYEVGKILLDYGADPNHANVDGLAALYAVIDMQYTALTVPLPTTAQEKITYLDLMKALLEKGANPNARIVRKLWFRPLARDQQWVSTAGATPFWRAAQANDVLAMKLLVAHGADPKLMSNSGDTALGVAAGLGWSGGFSRNALEPNAWMASVKYCLELGLDVNAVNKEGFTPVMGAAWRGNNELVIFLVKNGAKLDVRTQRGWAVTDMANAPALRTGVPIAHPETIVLLTELGAPPLTVVKGEAILGSSSFRKVAPAPKASSASSDEPKAAKPPDRR